MVEEFAFGSAIDWSYDNDFVRIFNNSWWSHSGVDNSSSFHADNPKNNFLVLDEGPIDNIKDSVGTVEKKSGINFPKSNTKFYLILHYSGDGK